MELDLYLKGPGFWVALVAGVSNMMFWGMFVFAAIRKLFN